jgi:hypothetical protein
MHGVIFQWRVLPDRRAEHDEIVRQTLAAERERCPEVLLNLMFGPAEDGACAEIQVYADAASHERFAARVARDDAALRALWDRYQAVCDPASWRTLRFDRMDFLAESFVRAAAGVGR